MHHHIIFEAMSSYLIPKKFATTVCLDRMPLINDILIAHGRIRKNIHETPVLTSQTVDNLVGKNVFFKCENFQKTGSFKVRGALNACMSKLEKLNVSETTLTGVVTHSSGNHGQALAWAAKILNKQCTVVVPRGTPPVKINAIRNYGGKVVECDPDSQSRVLTCNKIASEENKLIIPPYDDYDIMCGQGTVAVEFLQQVPQLDCIFVAVSGGGLISGISSYAKAIKPSIKIFACEPVGKNLEASLRKGERMWPNENKFLETKADAIRTVQCGQLTFPLILKLVEKEVFTQDDDSMTQACLLMFERLKIVGELAAGASLAAVLSEKFKKDEYKDLKNVGVIVCGGNIDIKSLQLSS